MSIEPAPEIWTTRKLLAWMGQAFAKRELESPRLLAEMLMAHVVGCDRIKLYTDPDRPAAPLERETLRDLVGRALKHEPVQYLVGEAWFFGLPFKVDRRCLIPRPSTETIVEFVLQRHRAAHGIGNQQGGGLLIGDVCTGSGCIAVSLLKHFTQARAVATDISEPALEVARENARRHGVSDRIEFLAGNLLGAFDHNPGAYGAGCFDYILSNPPYIPDDEWDAVEPNVKDHEPHLALRGGTDGLDLVRPLVSHAPALLKSGGQVLIEVAAARAGQALELLATNPLVTDARVLKDFEGLNRVIVARRL
ncbi:MAG: peptide chain release factor N(5)-glutamine methyltransferase [Phycisphaerales bacterium]